jgi:hypothetical protein
MRQIGLRAEILVNILFITAVAMFLIGIIAFKVTEKFAVQGKIESVDTIITALEGSYLMNGDIEGGIEFLKGSLNRGGWGIISGNGERVYFSTDGGRYEGGGGDPLTTGDDGEQGTEIVGVASPNLYEIKVAALVDGETQGLSLSTSRCPSDIV